MSAKGVYGGGSDVVRRTWKKDEFAQKAKEREERDDENEADEERKRLGKKKKKRDAEDDGEEKVRLQGRGEKLDLEGNVGKTQVVQGSGEASKQPGFYCKACDVTLRDSAAYLDHVNGRKHQRNIGMTMEVDRSSAEQVRAKLQSLKRKQEEGAKEYDFEARIAELRDQDELEKQKQREKKKRKKNKDAGGDREGSEEGAGPLGAEAEEDDMAKMMGFSGFTVKK